MDFWRADRPAAASLYSVSVSAVVTIAASNRGAFHLSIALIRTGPQTTNASSIVLTSTVTCNAPVVFADESRRVGTKQIPNNSSIATLREGSLIGWVPQPLLTDMSD